MPAWCIKSRYNPGPAPRLSWIEVVPSGPTVVLVGEDTGAPSSDWTITELSSPGAKRICTLSA